MKRDNLKEVSCQIPLIVNLKVMRSAFIIALAQLQELKFFIVVRAMIRAIGMQYVHKSALRDSCGSANFSPTKKENLKWLGMSQNKPFMVTYLFGKARVILDACQILPSTNWQGGV